ncbi:MAG: acylphosphatase [Betaproteobacteria bacterium RBG_16_58_11]|nr:MAG: acylphosphatase [Betaproteobacteria bacterium RBG_16_58_11]
MRTTKHLRLSGRVQGVFFRESMCREAAKLGVSGWVRNRRDGSLEAMLQGEAAQVEALVTWAKRGPPAAQVESMEISEGEGEFTGFERLPNS